MKQKAKREKMSYGIVGLGRFGYALATELAQTGAEILVIDRDEEKIRELREYTENAYVVKNLDKKTLTDTGIQNCDVAVVCVGEQMDTSILTVLNLVSMGIPKVIAKAASAEHGLILEKLGAEVVFPERDMAVRLANRLETSRVLDIVQLGERINVTKLKIPDRIVGKSVRDVNIRARFGFNIIAVENGSKVTETVTPEYVFRKGDVVYLSGRKEGIMKLNTWADK
ncbi:MAG: potassium channel family protein [Candidatus Avispirillum sp.]